MSEAKQNERIVMRLSDVDELITKLKRLNEIPLDKLDLIGDDGKIIPFSNEMLNEWAFIGLNNKFFIEQRCWENRIA